MSEKWVLQEAEKRAGRLVKELKASGQLEQAMKDFGKDEEWKLKALFKSQVVDYLETKKGN